MEAVEPLGLAQLLGPHAALAEPAAWNGVQQAIEHLDELLGRAGALGEFEASVRMRRDARVDAHLAVLDRVACEPRVGAAAAHLVR